MSLRESKFSRQIDLPGFGRKAQEMLSKSSVLCVGMGGLGCPVSLYLTSCGVGRLGIMDFDQVEISNLHRQVIYGEKDVGRKKVEVVKERLTDQHSTTEIIAYSEKAELTNLMNIVRDFDVVVDGTDNYESRYLINECCVKLGKPLVSASILRYEAQLAVFNSEEGPCYRCAFPSAPPTHLRVSCNEGGVLGASVGVLGTMQALLAIHTLVGKVNRWEEMRLIDLNSLSIDPVEIKKDPQCATCGTGKLKDEFDGMSVEKFGTLLKSEGMVLIDVRSQEEYDESNVGGSRLIPHSSILDGKFTEELAELSKGKEIVLYCRSGIRSAKVKEFLRSKGIQAEHLRGGFEAWKARSR